MREGVFNRQGSFAKPGFEAFSLQILHYKKLNRILVAHVVQRTDVWMIQAGDGSRFALETLGE